jgi:hypothetical protein
MQSLRGTLCGALLRCTLCDALVEIGVLSCQRVISWRRLRDALVETGYTGGTYGQTKYCLLFVNNKIVLTQFRNQERYYLLVVSFCLAVTLNGVDTRNSC